MTLSYHHAQFLVTENQPNFSESKKKKISHVVIFKKQKKNKIIIFEQLENLDWESELCFERNTIFIYHQNY